MKKFTYDVDVDSYVNTSWSVRFLIRSKILDTLQSVHKVLVSYLAKDYEDSYKLTPAEFHNLKRIFFKYKEDLDYLRELELDIELGEILVKETQKDLENQILMEEEISQEKIETEDGIKNPKELEE